jgi:hemerythrin-like domain-containing protein
MSTTTPARQTHRPARVPAPPLPAMDALDQTHREMLGMLDRFDALLAHLDDSGADPQARAAAREILDFFNGHARAHHAAEEKHVFPGLLAGSDEALAAHVRRLQQDHGWLEEDWLILAPHLEALATGYSGYEVPLLREALPVYRTLLQEHIALEESLIYPAARRAAQGEGG